MVSYHKKYLKYKLKYQKLVGGSLTGRSRARTNENTHNEMHPHGSNMHAHEHTHNIPGVKGPFIDKQRHYIQDPHTHVASLIVG